MARVEGVEPGGREVVRPFCRPCLRHFGTHYGLSTILRIARTDRRTHSWNLPFLSEFRWRGS